jgi:hypothetical protein
MLATADEDVAGRTAMMEEGLSLARVTGHKGMQAQALSRLGLAALGDGDLERARRLLEESDALARAAGDVWVRAASLGYLGWLALAEGRLNDAESHFMLLLEFGVGWGGYHTPLGLVGLGRVNVLRGDLEEARAVYCRMLIDLRETSAESVVLADALLHVASLDEVCGFHERAQLLVGANEGWHAAHGGARSIWEPSVRGPLLRGQVPIPRAASDAALARAREDGRRTNLDAAATYALAPVLAHSAVPTPVSL